MRPRGMRPGSDELKDCAIPLFDNRGWNHRDVPLHDDYESLDLLRTGERVAHVAKESRLRHRFAKRVGLLAPYFASTAGSELDELRPEALAQLLQWSCHEGVASWELR